MYSTPSVQIAPFGFLYFLILTFLVLVNLMKTHGELLLIQPSLGKLLLLPIMSTLVKKPVWHLLNKISKSNLYTTCDQGKIYRLYSI